MNSGIFTPKIVYKCEENYRNKKKEYIDAIKKYKYLINELQQWQKTYKHNMKIYKSGPVNFKVNDIDFIDTAQIKSIVYNNPELIKEGLIYNKSGILDKFKNFAKQSEPVVQECNPKYITELTELEKRYKYLKETYEMMYTETKKLQEESKKAAEEWRNKKEMKTNDNNNFRNNNDNNNNFRNNNDNNNNFRNNNFRNNNDIDF